MKSLSEQVEEALRARGLLVRGQRLLVAVSGGLDSMVLLRVLHEISARMGWRLAVAHFNHQLRGRSSDADERLVRHTAEEMRLPFFVGRGNVRSYSRAHKISIEMAARRLRHDFLARAAKRAGARCVALAQHADDQIELFLLRLLRGGGSEGLAGMKWRGPSPAARSIELVRPLLDQPKSVLRAYAAEKKVRFREDASNASLDIQRNRIRQELLPLLRRKYQPALGKTLLRAMDILATEGEFVAEVARDWLRRKRRSPFAKLPVAVQRRCIQLQLLARGIVGDYDLIEQLRLKPDRPLSLGSPAERGHSCPQQLPKNKPHPEALQGTSKAAADRNVRAPLKGVPTRWKWELFAVRDPNGVVFVEEAPPARFQDDCMDLDLSRPSGEAQFGAVKVRWRREAKRTVFPLRRHGGRELFDPEKVGPRILLRHWRSGDRFQPIGMAYPVKLQDLFTNQKVARARRHELVVATTEAGDVFWVEGLRISERFKLLKGSIHRLQWRWQRL